MTLPRPAPRSSVAQAIALLSHYGFDTKPYTVAERVGHWLEDYEPNWIRFAIIEALYQGRYKSLSVEHILAMWARRGQPSQHFTGDFERIICRKLPAWFRKQGLEFEQEIEAVEAATEVDPEARLRSRQEQRLAAQGVDTWRGKALAAVERFLVKRFKTIATLGAEPLRALMLAEQTAASEKVGPTVAPKPISPNEPELPRTEPLPAIARSGIRTFHPPERRSPFFTRLQTLHPALTAATTKLSIIQPVLVPDVVRPEFAESPPLDAAVQSDTPQSALPEDTVAIVPCSPSPDPPDAAIEMSTPETPHPYMASEEERLMTPNPHKELDKAATDLIDFLAVVELRS